MRRAQQACGQGPTLSGSNQAPAQHSSLATWRYEATMTENVRAYRAIKVGAPSLFSNKILKWPRSAIKRLPPDELVDSSNRVSSFGVFSKLL
jgi:hypothetical protein